MGRYQATGEIISFIGILNQRDSMALIALGRAISDGVFMVYFPDLLVKPEWQNKGIGSQMMNVLLKRFEGFHNQVLIAEDEAARAFYLKQGFKPETNALSILCPFKEIEVSL